MAKLAHPEPWMKALQTFILPQRNFGCITDRWALAGGKSGIRLHAALALTP